MSAEKMQGSKIVLSPLGLKNIAHKEGSDPQCPLLSSHHWISEVIVNYYNVSFIDVNGKQLVLFSRES